MAIKGEDDFPRGGTRTVPKTTTASKHKQENLFSVNAAPQVKKKAKKRKANVVLESPVKKDLISESATNLSYSTIKEDMVILGNVRKLHNLMAEIELPGRVYGLLSISAVSNTFTRQLQKQLQTSEVEDDKDLQLCNVFEIGQYVPVRTLEIKETTEKRLIYLCSCPTVVNRDLNHTMLKKSMLIWGSVEEKLEHGYKLDVGIQNVRAFLPDKNVEEAANYKIGQPLWCIIHKCEVSSSATTLRVSALGKHIQSPPEKLEDLNLHSLLPGMQVDFLVSKILKNGLHGLIFGQYKAYINETYLKTPLQKLKDFNEADIIKARILYIQPITKFVFLTLKELETVPEPTLKTGDIYKATVISETAGGIYIRLLGTEKGFVSYKRILHNHSREKDVKQLIKQKYSKGSKVTCRILDYNRMDGVYICTVEKAMLQEKVFTSPDLKIGQSLPVEIVEIQENGIVVRSGHVTGFVENLHISNVEYSENIKCKFKVGQTLKARVWNIKPENSVRFTLKQALVNSDTCLTDVNSVAIRKQYPGVVVFIGKKNIVVSYYNGIKGVINAKKLYAQSNTECEKPFFIGQVISPTVVNVDLENKKVMLSLGDEFSKKKQVKLGKKVSAEVRKIMLDGLEVFIQKLDLPAFIPLNQISINYELNPSLLAMYKIGDTLDDLLCISKHEKLPTLSIREARAFNKHNLEIPNLHQLKKGDIIRCSYLSKSERGIFVMTPVKGSRTGKFEILKENLTENTDLNSFVPHQAITAKIIDVNPRTKAIKLSAKIQEVFDCNIESTMDILEEYLINTEKIKQHLLEQGDPLASLELGQHVKCVVNRIGENGGCSVFLPNKEQGLADVHHCPAKIKPGQTIDGVILWVDYTKRFAEVTLNPKFTKIVSPLQDGNVTKTMICTDDGMILLIREHFALAAIKNNRQLVFMPTKIHENDCLGLAKEYVERVNDKTKILLFRKANNHIMAFLKDLQPAFTKRTSSTKTSPTVQIKKRKLEINEVQNKKQKTEAKISHEVAKASVDRNTIETSKKRKLETSSTDKAKEVNMISSTSLNKSESNVPLLPGMSDFFTKEDERQEMESSSEDEQQEDSEDSPKKKKRLTKTEHAELARQEEERISKIEKELADFSGIPESAEQFDRVLLAKPDDSVIWSQYVAFHLSNTEIEKARSVIKRALNTIKLDKIQEKFNIWIVYLNLENMYGTRETFESVFDQAVRYNDDYAIYLETIKILAASDKLTEMEEKIKKFRGKFKQLPKCWVDLAKVYYSIGKVKEARNLKEAALKSVQDKKEQTNLIVQYAILEFKFGDQTQGEALFETILDSYPGRVDVWCSYVDQLVKKDSIDLARRVLERAVSQKLSVMKMRSLFKKFQEFERAHGTEESLQNVKDALLSYASNIDK